MPALQERGAGLRAGNTGYSEHTITVLVLHVGGRGPLVHGY
jgi:hypothetical protein